jgi:hypothetical protein
VSAERKEIKQLREGGATAAMRVRSTKPKRGCKKRWQYQEKREEEENMQLSTGIGEERDVLPEAGPAQEKSTFTRRHQCVIVTTVY